MTFRVGVATPFDLPTLLVNVPILSACPQGVLVESLRNGYWIILDELNLAPSEVSDDVALSYKYREASTGACEKRSFRFVPLFFSF